MDTSTGRVVGDATGDLRRELFRSMATPVGSALALGLPMALSPLRGAVGRPPLLAVLAVLVAAVAATGGRWSGVTAAVVGAMAFDTFLTAHRGELRVDRVSFWLTLALLALLAVVTAKR
jgi:K+-sensing histidine kinase KdpD